MTKAVAKAKKADTAIPEVVKASNPGKATKVEAKKEAAPAPAAAGKASSVVRRKAKVLEETIETEPDTIEASPEAEPVEEVIEKKIAKEEKVATPEPIIEAKEAKKETPVVAAPNAAAPVEESAEKKVIIPPRKKEVSIGASGVVSASTPSTAVGKRNIIGRMDLSRVPQNNRGGDGRVQQGGTAAGGRPQGNTGFGAAGPARNKGNLRAGFVQQAPTTVEAAEPFDPFSKKKDDKRRGGKVGVAEATPVKVKEGEETKHFDAAEFRKREMVFQPKKKKGMLDRPAMKTEITTPKASKRILKINKTMKLSELANQMGVKAPELVKALMKNGVMATMNTDLDFDTIALIVTDFNFEAVNAFKTADEIIFDTAFGDLAADLVPRAPVVAVMGHVDHGKTSLLDAIRKANVAGGEAGGITQHIGAYQVKLEGGEQITFLDTPGHEAFTAMRARGANVTDIAIIVVAADDGMMPQTAEAINHAKAAKVPLIIAINKIDKPGANPDRIKQQLTELEVVPEEWGGTAIFREVSAIKKTGIKELLESILLVAEVQELKANPKRSGTGTVIESKLDKGRGNLATILVKDGTVKIGQHIVAGSVVGKVKSLQNYLGERVLEAGPGMPVEVLGLDGIPSAGDKFDIVKDEKTALQAAQVRKDLVERDAQPHSKMSLEELFSKVNKGDVKELAIVLKADVAGSMEALQGMLAKANTAEVKIKIIHAAIGGITESDVLLASAAKGIIIGFGVRPDGGATTQSKRLGVEVRTYTIVYELMDDLKKAMTGMLTPDIVERVMGRAEVRNTFSVPKLGVIGGCSVLDGKVQRNNNVRLVRDGKIIYDGKIGSLKRFKDDAKEVAQGFECGIGIENFNDLKVGDIIEAYIKEEVARQLTQPEL